MDTISSFERLFHVLPPSSVVDDEGKPCCDCSDEKNLKKERERKEEEEKRVEGLEAVLASETLQGLFHSSNLSLLNTRFILPACFSVNKRAGCELVTLVKDIRASSILGACFKLLHRINAMRPPSLPLPRNYTAVEIETRHGSI